jgi:hypothetical protein
MPEKRFEQFRAALALRFCVAVGVHKVEHHLFPVTNEHRVHKRRNGFRVAGAGATADDERVAFSAFACQERDIRKRQHLQNVGIAHFVEERKAENVEHR